MRKDRKGKWEKMKFANCVLLGASYQASNRLYLWLFMKHSCEPLIYIFTPNAYSIIKQKLLLFPFHKWEKQQTLGNVPESTYLVNIGITVNVSFSDSRD